MSPAIKQRMKHELTASMTHWQETAVRAHNRHKQPISAYAEVVLQHMHAVVDALQDDQSYTAAYKQHNDSTVCPELDDLGAAWLDKLRKMFVVTSLDKLSKVFNIVCLKYYVASVQHNLRTVGNYAEVQPAGGATSTEVAADQIALAARQHAGYLYDRVSPESLAIM
jgi:hypothetical protein